MNRYLLPFIGCLALSPVALADWPTIARNGFIAECIESAQIEHPSSKAQAFCVCAADQASASVSAGELESLSNGNMEQGTQRRLMEASSSCSGHLAN